MKAVTYHGKRDVRVDTVPDPTIEEPTDAIVRITSTGICGSDLHLYEVLGPFIDEGDILGHEPMGVVEAVGSEVTQIKPGDRVVIPFNISCGHCFMCDQKLYSQCETTQVARSGQGRLAARLHQAVRSGAGRAGRAAAGSPGALRSDQGSRRARPTSGSFTCPTCFRPPGRRSSTPRFRRTAPWPCSGSARSARCRAGSRCIAERRRCSGSTSSRSGSRWPAGMASTPSTRASTTTSPRRCASLTDGRGPDSVIDAVGMEAHGAPLGKLAQQLASMLPDAVAAKMTEKAGVDRLSVLHASIDTVRRGGNDLAQRRLRRHGRPDADDGPVRQADPAPHGTGQRQALDRST